jgi:hypothetical protein
MAQQNITLQKIDEYRWRIPKSWREINFTLTWLPIKSHSVTKSSVSSQVWWHKRREKNGRIKKYIENYYHGTTEHNAPKN